MRWKIIILMLLIGSMGFVLAQDAESTETPEVDSTQILNDAQILVTEAKAIQDENFGMVGSILDLIQAGGVFVALVTVAAVGISGWFGLTSIRDFRKQLDVARGEIDELENLKSELTAQVNRVNSELINVRREIELLDKAKDEVLAVAEKLSMMNDLPTEVDERMRLQQEEANTQLQALSLVQFAIQQITIGNRKAALNTLARATELQEENPVINYFRGEVLVREGEYEQGIPFLQKATQAGDMPDASATLAYAYRMMGDENPDKKDKYYSSAENIYTDLRDDYPDLLDISGESVYGALAGLYRNRNMIDKAIEIYEQLIEVTPNSSYLVNNLGLLHFEHDEKPFADRNKGKEYFEKSQRKARATLKLEGTDYWRLFDLITAEVALEESDWNPIQDLLDSMFDLDPIPDDILKLERGLHQLEKSEQSPQFVQKALDYIQSRMTSVQT